MNGLRAFTMPKWGIEMEEGTVAEWMIAEGQDFARGDVLTLIETDKITNEFEAEFAARLVRVVVPAGETRRVGTLLAVLGEAGQDVDVASVDEFVAGYRPSGGGAAAPAVPSAPPTPIPASVPVQVASVAAIPDDLAISPAARALAQAENVDVTAIKGSGRAGRVTFQDVTQHGRDEVGSDGPAVSIAPTTASVEAYFASPLAKRLAVQHGIDLAGISGSGPRGRIAKADVLANVKPLEEVTAPAVAAPLPGDDVEVVPMSPMRKAIARQLTLSKTTIPHFYLRNSARVDALIAMRAQAKRATGDAPSVNDYLIRACAMALRAHPDMNVQVHGDVIHRYANADISVAVATDKGLLTPIVRSAHTKSVAKISTEVRSLAERARAGRLSAEEFQGGSFSISNLGMFGIDQFDAIINPPQAAILAVGAARQTTYAVDHALTFSTRIALTLSCDHRAIDGAVGARFLAELTRLIETPEELTA